ncbi:MAG: hypothetical protein ACK55I_02560, partial [bacterium]
MGQIDEVGGKRWSSAGGGQPGRAPVFGTVSAAQQSIRLFVAGNLLALGIELETSSQSTRQI